MTAVFSEYRNVGTVAGEGAENLPCVLSTTVAKVPRAQEHELSSIKCSWRHNAALNCRRPLKGAR